MLHPDSYPHIFDSIAAYASHSALLALRAVCRSAAESADAALFTHATLVLDWAGRVTLHANGGPRLRLPADLHDTPKGFARRRLARVLAHITHLTLAGAWEFGCVPSLDTVSSLVARMHALERITLVPDPYGRRWRACGSVIMDLEGEPVGCTVRRVARPPTPPLWAPNTKAHHVSSSSSDHVAIRTHSGSEFSLSVLDVLGCAADVTVVLSLWGPRWNACGVDWNAPVSLRCSHKALVVWRYACATSFVAGALEPSVVRKLEAANVAHPPVNRKLTIVGLEQVHPAYLDHQSMPDYETIACFRDRVKNVLEHAREEVEAEQNDENGDEDHNEDEDEHRQSENDAVDSGYNRRGRSRGPSSRLLRKVDETAERETETYSRHGLPTPDSSDNGSDTESHNDLLSSSTSGLVDPTYFADVVDRLRDYAASRSPSPAGASRSTSRARLAVPSPSPSPPRRSSSSSPSYLSASSPSATTRTHTRTRTASSAARSASRSGAESLYTRLAFVTHSQFAAHECSRPVPGW